MNHHLAECLARRSALLAKMPNACIALIPSAEVQFRNADTEYPFRQDSDFYYLTGLKEPESMLVLLKDTQGKTETHFFCRPKQPEKEIWTGPMLGLEQAGQFVGADKTHAYAELDKVMPLLFENKANLLYEFVKKPDFLIKINKWRETIPAKSKSIKAPDTVLDLALFLRAQRVIKTPFEITLLKQAASISAKAHCRVMQYCKPNQMEYELEAEFLYACTKAGCRAAAYPTIVGGGMNACTLHYIHNNKSLKDGELVLVDAGGEFDYYAADITRTFPINGRFTADQKALYEVVLKAQKAAIEKIKPGVTWETLQDTVVLEIVQGLVKLGILQGEVKTLIDQKAYKPFYMHTSGHWLGLDVHDVGEYKQDGKSVLLKPGMVFTVEPGIYIAPGSDQVDKRFWGMGIRIEDDILVTEQGHEVLSHAVPKEIAEIETLMQSNVT